MFTISQLLTRYVGGTNRSHACPADAETLHRFIKWDAVMHTSVVPVVSKFMLPVHSDRNVINWCDGDVHEMYVLLCGHFFKSYTTGSKKYIQCQWCIANSNSFGRIWFNCCCGLLRACCTNKPSKQSTVEQRGSDLHAFRGSYYHVNSIQFLWTKGRHMRGFLIR